MKWKKSLVQTAAGKSNWYKTKNEKQTRSLNNKTWICPILLLQYGANCTQPMAEIFFVGLRRFFAALLGGMQEKATINRRKMACQRAMFSYEDEANVVTFFVWGRIATACKASLAMTNGVPGEA